MLIVQIRPSGFSFLEKQKSNNRKLSYQNQSSSSDVVSFTGETEIKLAEKIVKKHALISGGLGLTLSQVVGVDSASLLANNICMVRSIAKKVYKSKIDKNEVNHFLTGASLSATGAKVAAGPLTFVPVIGNIANTAISSSITKTVGNKFIKFCEKRIS